MPIEYVPEFDDAGNHVGGYTESVPDMPVKEEPDCYACNDAGCPACDGSQVARSEPVTDADWPRSAGTWGGGYSDEPPF
ncbi:hypothetical protein [Streptomyces sp. NPDC056683]|uniref:hypothetical protein n=1 Tax=Streptomyces sp. NPDC056683 TaxID=3345910 RepID=UPI0036AA3B77